MCRLLGYAASTPTTFNDVVGKNFDEFINLSIDHCDGWGIASSESNKASLYKEPVAANKSSHFKDERDEFLNNVKDICVYNQNFFLQYAKNSYEGLYYNKEMQLILNFLLDGKLEIFNSVI